ncbi:MAG: hypothetical protein H6719_08400 [Sandaracinaceae bacterium]|nr:hypothetical protein [Sandaracinaceae bacterium]
MLVAFNASGALMTGFQDNGRLADDIDLSSREEFVDMVIQAVGGEERILVLASVADPDEMMLVRYTSGGDRDTTFGVNGEIRISVPGVGADASTSAAALAVDTTDGSIVVAGHSSVQMLGRYYGTPVVARFTADGDPAPCGASGVFLWRPEVNIVPPPAIDNPFIEGAVQSFDMVVNDMAVVEDVGIVLVGYLHFWDFHARTPWVGRLTATCIPDQSFGDYGTGVKLIDTTAFTGSNDDNAWLSAVAVDGINVYAAGTTATFSPGRGLFGGRMFVIALEADGSLDASFGPPLGPTAGGVVVEPFGWSEVAHGLAVSPGPSGEIFVVGESLQDVRSSRRRIRAAVLAKSGPVTFVSWPSNDFGVLDAWATDVVLRADGQPSVSVAMREDPSPFNPPPPGP